MNESPTHPPKPRKTGLIQASAVILWKDLKSEARSKEILAAMFVFALLAILIFSFALELDRRGREANAAGVLWVTLIFAGTLGLGRSLGREKDQSCLEGLLLAPVDRSALYFGKLAGNGIFMLLVALLLLPFLSVLFDTSFFKPLIGLVIGLGILGYAGIGTLIASMSIHARGRELLLPILLLPLALSILIPAVRATRGLLESAPLSEWSIWLNLLAASTLIYITLSYLFFDYIVEE